MRKVSFIFMFFLFSCSSQVSRKAPSRYPAQPLSQRVMVYTTAENTDYRLSLTDILHFKDSAQPLETEACVFIDPSKTFQTVLGIGGAITDASAETFAKLSAQKQKELLQAYYNPEKGIGYTLARTNINSCDFSSDSYTYVADHDSTLKTFNIDHDLQYRVPFIKQAMATAQNHLTLYASPWSPPAWMKDNNSMLHGGKLKPQYYQAWANYYLRFIEAYEKAGVPVWGLSVQNEPMANQRWESCIYTAENERDFIKNYLGPALKKNMATKKLIAWDHNRDQIFQRSSVILNDPQAAKYVWGIGYHWYETWTGGNMQFENVKRVAESFPDKHLIFTEGCIEKFDRSKLQDWWPGEKYGSSMVNDFNDGAAGWTDWNILLDENGGPNHAGNFCFAPVHADTKADQLIYTSSYYYIGHFSKFIKPGAKRISASSSRDQLKTTAFINTDGTVAVVVLNPTNEKISYNILLGARAATTTALPHSIATLLLGV